MAKILVVEDEKVLNQAYQMILEREGFQVTSAFDGTEAMEITKTLEPDLILLDLRMPKMGGVEFLKEYKQPEKHPKVQIIVFSNLDMQQEIDDAYKLGASKYMLKAWASPKELIQIVNEALSAKTQSR